MPSFDELCRRGCVGDLIHVIGQVPDCVATRSSDRLDDASLGMVVLWMLLMRERRPWTVCLEELGVDVRGLARELDGLLGEKTSTAATVGRAGGGQEQLPRESRRQLDRFLNDRLDRAGREASALGDRYLGNEHLLLAILADADDPLAAVLSRHGMHYPSVKKALTKALSRVLMAEVVVEPRIVAGPRKPWVAILDGLPATGVPRRFSMAAMFVVMTLFALLFAFMELLGASPEVFTVVAIFVAVVGLGQTLFFGGKYPRAASVCVGACLLPVEILAWIIFHFVSSGLASFSAEGASWTFMAMLFCVPLGGFLGYLAGGLAGGVFLVLDLLAKRAGEQSDEPAEEA